MCVFNSSQILSSFLLSIFLFTEIKEMQRNNIATDCSGLQYLNYEITYI